MPELPEVETVRRALSKKIINKKIINIEVPYSKLIKNIESDQFSKLLANQKILRIDKHSKYLLFILDDYVIVSHLRMEGKYYYIESDEILNNINMKHVLAKFNFSDGTKLFYHDTRKFGTIHLYKKDDFSREKVLSHVANEPWDLDFEEFTKKLSKTSRPIKSVLLDQSVIAGLGNIYVDEVLFASKINPENKSNCLNSNQYRSLLENSKIILKLATEMGGTTIKSYTSSLGIEGTYQNELKVHTRVGKECKICKTKIEKIKVGGRGTYYCPNCQKK